MASPGNFSAGFAREKRAVSPVAAPPFFAAAAKSPSFAAAAICLAGSRATRSPFCRFGHEGGRGLERRPELVGLRLGFAVTRLGRQSAPDLRRDLLQGLAAALLDLDRLDRVKAERGPDRLGRHLALLQREERSLE